MKVLVYFNLHRLCLSVKALEGEYKGRVVAHVKSVSLEDVEFKVSEAGRQRVLREKSKNVHAGLVGTLTGVELDLLRLPLAVPSAVTEVLDDYQVATYNPYRFDSFVTAESHLPVRNARKVTAIGKEIRFAL